LSCAARGRSGGQTLAQRIGRLGKLVGTGRIARSDGRIDGSPEPNDGFGAGVPLPLYRGSLERPGDVIVVVVERERDAVHP
jgi:hypothetical protein